MTSTRVKQALESIPPEHFARLLAAKGWLRLEQRYFGTEQWVHPKTGYDVLLPTRAGVRDYARLVRRIVEALEKVEGRDEAAILQDLQLANADVIRVARPTDDPGDTIPLAAGRALVESAVRMLGAAAAASIEARAVLPRRRPRQAAEYLDRRVRLGHTERGSYVVTIVSDTTPLLTPGGLPGLLEYLEGSFPRLVTRTLAKSLAASTPAAEAIVGGRDLHDAIKSGVSADLLESLSAMLAGAPVRQGLKFVLTWAVTQPEPRTTPSEVRLEHSNEELFAEAARKLRELEPLEGIAVTGIVERLHRREGHEAGSATLACIIEQVPRKLQVPLSAEDYELAIRAHRDNHVVVLRATIERRGSRYYAANVRNFRLTGD